LAHPKILAWRPYDRPLAGFKGASGVQRHPRRRKMRHRNPWGSKEVGYKVYIWSVDSQENNKIVATRCHILKLKCTKFDFGWDSAPNPAGGAHSAPPYPHTP